MNRGPYDFHDLVDEMVRRQNRAAREKRERDAREQANSVWEEAHRRVRRCVRCGNMERFCTCTRTLVVCWKCDHPVQVCVCRPLSYPGAIETTCRETDPPTALVKA